MVGEGERREGGDGWGWGGDNSAEIRRRGLNGEQESNGDKSAVERQWG